MELTYMIPPNQSASLQTISQPYMVAKLDDFAIWTPPGREVDPRNRFRLRLSNCDFG